MKLHPLLAGLINALLPGLGYVLLRERRVFGELLLAGSVACLMLSFFEPTVLSQSFFVSSTLIGKVLESIWYLCYALAYGYDAYSLAERKRVTVVLPPETPSKSVAPADLH